MKNIGLIIADNNEFQNFDELTFVKKIEDNNFQIKLYEYKNYYIYIAYSRIGLVNSSITTQFLIDKYNVKEIWNYGAVGSTGKFNLFDVVIPTRFYYYDVITPWYKRGQIPNENEYFCSSFENKNGEIISIASGNSFIDNQNYINDLKKELSIDLIDMESCAIAHTCFRNNIPFYSIKGISDVIGLTKVSKEDINKNINKASKLAFEKLLLLLK